MYHVGYVTEVEISKLKCELEWKLRCGFKGIQGGVYTKRNVFLEA